MAGIMASNAFRRAVAQVISQDKSLLFSLTRCECDSRRARAGGVADASGGELVSPAMPGSIEKSKQLINA